MEHFSNNNRVIPSHFMCHNVQASGVCGAIEYAWFLQSNEASPFKNLWSVQPDICFTLALPTLERARVDIQCCSNTPVMLVSDLKKMLHVCRTWIRKINIDKKHTLVCFLNPPKLPMAVSI